MDQHPKYDDVTARVIFKGLMFGLINSDFDNLRYEMGMIECPGHSPTIEITTSGVAERTQVEWPEGHDLIIKAMNPIQDGVRRYPTNAVGVVPEANFKLVLDVEGPDLHNRGINVNTEAFTGRRIGVTAGLFYTHERTVELDLYTWTHSGDSGTSVKHFGRIAKHTGVNIACQEGEDNGVAIVDAVTGEIVSGGWMPARPGVSYEIVVDNDCSGSLPTVGSDFRYMYQVMSPSDPYDVRKFDFARTYSTSGLLFFTPDTCNHSTGGGGKGIGLDWSNL